MKLLLIIDRVETSKFVQFQDDASETVPVLIGAKNDLFDRASRDSIFGIRR